jgi:MFS family permease
MMRTNRTSGRSRASESSLGRDFAWFWIGQSVSLIGSQITVLALPLTAVLMLDAAAREMGFLQAARWLPFALFALPVGVFADRTSRRPLLIAADLGRAVVLALVPLAAGLLLSLAIRATAPALETQDAAAARPSWWRDVRHVPPLVWLAFFVTLYINLVSGVVLTFFPIYGLAIGLTLTQIGALQGIHGATAAAVRFLSGIFFRFVSYQRTLPLMVLASGASVALIGGVKVFLVLAVAWGLLGLTRGLLRVASAALVMDSAGELDTKRGAASGIYLAGLDLGKVLGPLVGGVGAHAVGLRATFLIVSAAFPAVYFGLAAALRRRNGHEPRPVVALDSPHGPTGA